MNFAPSFLWKNRNESPTKEGKYIVEYSLGDDENNVRYSFDEYKDGRWGYAQWVNKWLDISETDEFVILNHVHELNYEQ